MSTRQENGFPHSSSPLAKGGSRGVRITVSPRRRVTRSLPSPSSLRRFVAPSPGATGGLPASASLDPSIPRSLDPSRRRRAAFSLLEMMIAIVILGIGLIMVATMFPVAWTRARTLSETTVERSIAAGAQARLSQSLKPATLKTQTDGTTTLDAGSLMGDLFYDPVLGPLAYSDTRVHSLNASNVLAVDPATGNIGDRLVDENLWKVENIVLGFSTDPEAPAVFEPLGAKSPFVAQLPFAQRVYPPLPAPPSQGAGVSAEELRALEANWYGQLDQRRFVLSLFHRLQSQVGPSPLQPPYTPAQYQEHIAAIQSAMARPRVFDVYYVTLRRPNPTNRYAMQDSTQVPDPLNPQATPVALQPLAGQYDVLFPAAWRVEVEFPTIMPFRAPPAGSAEPGPTGVPTEITVPRPNYPGTPSLIIAMFPEGARFIDEVSGRVYRVVKRRVAADGASATLTLDREVFREDMQNMDPADPQSYYNRTVWVFPPAVDRSLDPANPNFDGPSPVVSIEVRTMTLSPSN